MAKRSERKPCSKRNKFSHTKGIRQTRPDKNTLWKQCKPEDRLDEEHTDNKVTVNIHLVWRRI
eukprot:16437525-Heterocapsa_arctica.AAC.1